MLVILYPIIRSVNLRVPTPTIELNSSVTFLRLSNLDCVPFTIHRTLFTSPYSDDRERQVKVALPPGYDTNLSGGDTITVTQTYAKEN